MREMLKNSKWHKRHGRKLSSRKDRGRRHKGIHTFFNPISEAEAEARYREARANEATKHFNWFAYIKMFLSRIKNKFPLQKK